MLRTFMVISNLVICLFYGYALFDLQLFTFGDGFSILTLIIASLAVWIVTSGLSVLYGYYLAPTLDLGCLSMIFIAPVIGFLGLVAFDLLSQGNTNLNIYQYIVIGTIIGFGRLPDYIIYEFIQVRA